MKKLELIDTYIGKCDALLEANRWEDAAVLVKEIISVFNNDIDAIYSNLNMVDWGNRQKVTHIEDLACLRGKLVLLKTNLLNNAHPQL